MEQIQAFINGIREKNLIDIVIAIALIILFYIMSSSFSKLVIKIFKIKEKDKKKIKQSDTYKGLKSIFTCAGIYIAILILDLPEQWFILCMKLIRAGIIINIAKILSDLISPESVIMKKVCESERFSENKSTLKVISKIVKIVLYVIAGFIIIADFGYDLSGIITGLGLGSVVIALAAQEIVSNFLSGMAIASEKPFQIGDFVTIGEYSGTIKEIKFRSVKIKTVDNTVVTIQNTKILEEAVVNYASMEQRRLDLELRLPLNTNTNTITEAIESIKFVLQHEQNVIKNTVQINIDEIKSDAIVIKAYMYLSIVDYVEYINLKSNINFNIMRLLESKNIKLAYPGTEVYVNK